MFDPSAPDPKPAPYKLPRPYVITWGILASVAATYLALAIFVPGAVGISQYSGQSHSATDDIASADNETLRDLQNRLAKAQLQIAKMSARVENAERIAAQAAPQPQSDEAAPSGALGSAIAGIQTINAQPENATVESPVQSEAQLAQAQLSQGQATTINPALSPIETGSIQIPPPPSRAPAPPLQTIQVVATKQIAPATTTIQPTVTPAPFTPVQTARAPSPTANPEMGVRVATGPSVDALRLEWNQILKRAGPDLAGLNPSVVPSSQAGTIGQAYDLIAGPLKTLSDAQRICNAAAIQRSICEIRRITQPSANL